MRRLAGKLAVISVPRIVATVGMHGSASTWVFNIIRELLGGAVGQGNMLTLYADTVEALPPPALREDKYLVIKSHHGSNEMDNWLRERAVPVVMSIRDPRDACVSMALRFEAPLQHTARWIANDCARLRRLAAGNMPILRYEDRFFEHPGEVDRLAGWLGVELGAGVRSDIFARYRTEAVRAFARGLSALPPERLTMVGAFAMDRETQILAPHIGDCSTGKWRGLPENVQVELTRYYAPFLQQFSY